MKVIAMKMEITEVNSHTPVKEMIEDYRGVPNLQRIEDQAQKWRLSYLVIRSINTEFHM